MLPTCCSLLWQLVCGIADVNPRSFGKPPGSHAPPGTLKLAVCPGVCLDQIWSQQRKVGSKQPVSSGPWACLAGLFGVLGLAWHLLRPSTCENRGSCGNLGPGFRPDGEALMAQAEGSPGMQLPARLPQRQVRGKEGERGWGSQGEVEAALVDIREGKTAASLWN